MKMTTIKTVAVFAIIFGCFAILYPKIFHPMVLHIFGLNREESHSAPKGDPFSGMPPHMRAMRHEGMKSGHGRGAQPPHPAMRGAEMKRQMGGQTQGQGGGGGGGLIGVVLPMYAVGIVIYLIYTLSKVITKKDKGCENDSSGSKDYLGSHFSGSVGGRGGRQGMRGEDGGSLKERVIKQQQDLERLLLRADRDDISDVEMSQLRQKLMDTEAQMSRILQAMESMQGQVSGGATVLDDDYDYDDDDDDYQDDDDVDDDTKEHHESSRRRHDNRYYDDENADQSDDQDFIEERRGPRKYDRVENLGPRNRRGGNNQTEGRVGGGRNPGRGASREGDFRNGRNLAEEMKEKNLNKKNDKKSRTSKKKNDDDDYDDDRNDYKYDDDDDENCERYSNNRNKSGRVKNEGRRGQVSKKWQNDDLNDDEDDYNNDDDVDVDRNRSGRVKNEGRRGQVDRKWQNNDDVNDDNDNYNDDDEDEFSKRNDDERELPDDDDDDSRGEQQQQEREVKDLKFEDSREGGMKKRGQGNVRQRVQPRKAE